MRITNQEESKNLKKDRECLHCTEFWECEGKPEGVKSCLNFNERPELNGSD